MYIWCLQHKIVYKKTLERRDNNTPFGLMYPNFEHNSTEICYIKNDCIKKEEIIDTNDNVGTVVYFDLELKRNISLLKVSKSISFVMKRTHHYYE